jgi:hypothetical protein
VLLVFHLGHHTQLQQRRVALLIPSGPEVTCLSLTDPGACRSVLLPAGTDLSLGLGDLCPCLLNRHFVVARIELNQQLSGFHWLIVLDVQPRDGPIDT